MTRARSLSPRRGNSPGGEPSTLLMLSGGFDSAWALWKLVEAGEVVRTHHVRLENAAKRADAEDRSVRRIYGWMRDEGFGHLIYPTRSIVNFGNLPYIPRDHHTWGYVAGVLLADPNEASITKVVRTIHKDSLADGPESSFMERVNDAWRRPIEFIADREFEFTFPMIHMTKAEVLLDMPESLRSLCWGCRNPSWGNPCGECVTCVQVNAALGGIRV